MDFLIQYCSILRSFKMLFQITLFIVLFSVTHSQEECVTNQQCLHSIAETNQTFTSTIIYYWQERLRLDQEITDSLREPIERLNEDIKVGPTQCQDFLLIETPGRYSDKIQNICFNDAYEAQPPKEVEQYFSGTYEGSLEDFCKIYVDYLNSNCAYLSTGIKQTIDCNTSQIFDDMFVKPWEECSSDDNNV